MAQFEDVVATLILRLEQAMGLAKSLSCDNVLLSPPQPSTPASRGAVAMPALGGQRVSQSVAFEGHTVFSYELPDDIPLACGPRVLEAFIPNPPALDLVAKPGFDHSTSDLSVPSDSGVDAANTCALSASFDRHSDQVVYGGSVASGGSDSGLPVRAVRSGAAIGPESIAAGLRDVWVDVSDYSLDRYLSTLKARHQALRSLRRIDGSEWPMFFRSTSSLSTTLAHVSIIIRPVSIFRLLWDLATLLFFMYDLVMIPLQVFKIRSAAIEVIEVICVLFWVGDIGMSFITAFYNGPILERRARMIAQNYAKTWLGMDLLLVVVQGMRPLQDFHVFFKSIQTIRLLRIMKLYRLVLAIRERSNSNHVHLYLDFLGVLFNLTVAVHFISCGWFWLGEDIDDGWTRREDVQGADTFYKYFASCRWTIAQVSGRTDLEIRTTPEYVYTCVACVFGLICMSVFISSITHTMIELGALNRERSSQIRLLNGYLEQSHLSSAVAVKVKTDFMAHQRVSINLGTESEVLKFLPKQIRMDLLYEIRAPAMVGHVLFHDFDEEFPRMLRHVCAEAVKSVLVQEDEVAFAAGDACTRVLFVEVGELYYVWTLSKRFRRPSKSVDIASVVSIGSAKHADSDTSCRRTPATNSAPETVEAGEMVVVEQWLSEAAVWVVWENCGTLTARTKSSLLALEVPDFIGVVKLFRDARSRCVLYARAFLAHLELMPKRSDIMECLQDYIPANFELPCASEHAE